MFKYIHTYIFGCTCECFIHTYPYAIYTYICFIHIIGTHKKFEANRLLVFFFSYTEGFDMNKAEGVKRSTPRGDQNYYQNNALWVRKTICKMLGSSHWVSDVLLLSMGALSILTLGQLWLLSHRRGNGTQIKVRVTCACYKRVSASITIKLQH